MTLAASGTLEAGAKIQYLRTIACGGVLRQFDLLSSDIENMQTLNVDGIVKGLAQYVSAINFPSK